MIEPPNTNVEPSAGESIEIVGAREPLITLIIITYSPVSPPESVTEAVIVWVPSPSFTENDPPVPIVPSRSEVQVKLVVRFPSSLSIAVPAKSIQSLLE